MFYGLLCIIIIALCVKIYLLKKSAREIASEFADRLKTDTNTLIYISSHDKDMRYLSDSINKQLKILRKEHLQYHQGNTELKNAITNISHDLRTPLTAIAGNLYMIGKTDDLSEIRGYIAVIAERTETMKQLTEELFRYSMIVSNESKEDTEEVFVNQVLAESISSFYPVLTEKDITPQIHLTDARIVRNVNRSELARVFSNLLNNAVKYSNGDLDITLSDTGEITFANTAKELSTIEVEQLFDRFYTVEAAHHSTGLGLSIARTLVERMGGSITAEYDDGRLTIRIML
ncbi:sensor histidine kinase [Ruminococcus albus]|jgi:signal transduction histidine kinase|uniref:histidine kinase n=3 Tax=Ruminococcus TaxID=1263 RepID=E9SFK8_RUMAL|nr:HAMP domain-containing sensor histidine kinase [Ruminococcus albus]EGC01937.1 putative phage tail component, N-terminal domain protein [Ruminococcus albus 8]MCC3352900.1 HAMP domain-containing histidine kinase [Ruminococcus albus 8]